MPSGFSHFDGPAEAPPLRWRRPVRLCGLCLLEWQHEDCQEVTLWVPWWAEKALRRAYLEARR